MEKTLFSCATLQVIWNGQDSAILKDFSSAFFNVRSTFIVFVVCRYFPFLACAL